MNFVAELKQKLHMQNVSTLLRTNIRLFVHRLVFRRTPPLRHGALIK